ncbi:uncharacterized protein L969DRAFT_102557 [Mixia osmundae IAM 14324]|uniref:NADH dehydrogenase [ubiquinone] 1 alpha subcomplex subunit n=1 Tax=Mixia osmundae (strain CBS 9802 / IAM 14324 / JCM 22182 / KY 12970) TaxID=764103 RepID=G7E962_MIXOS|nr:uncharacterized protein L969DRAFT_102557 [Mixia osmundae IAM 14324]KEI39801.1 hypothetical protein L969DRAFT_102557 [Mixia osmundae IAM 14324]GAA99181.1 hypothetical protein E5Q_05873 [Mixia osmundae IAM 14324]
MFRGLARLFRIGQWRHYVGTDLQGNCYFEIPYGLEYRKSRRTVKYAVDKEWSDYQPNDMPPQWSAWLRRTRTDAPTMQELQGEAQRVARLQQNVARLRIAYADEKRRIAEDNTRLLSQDQRLPAPTSQDTLNRAKQPEVAQAASAQIDALPAQPDFIPQGRDGRTGYPGQLLPREPTESELEFERKREAMARSPLVGLKPGTEADPGWKVHDWTPASRRR